MTGVYFEADLSGANLSFATLKNAGGYFTIFTTANLNSADLSCEYDETTGGGCSARMYGKAPVFRNLQAVQAVNANFTDRILVDGSAGNFTNATFHFAELAGDFTNAIFIGADLSSANLTTILSDELDLTGATYSGGSPSNQTLFPAGFDPVAAGMTLVPEPTTALLLGLGLVGLTAARRRLR